MVETRQQHQLNPNSSSLNTKPLLWSHVVRSKKKGNNSKQQQIVSFNPTLVNRPVTEAEAAQNAINGSPPPSTIALLRPFIKGMKQDSVFIDLTAVKDRSLLNKALLQFNKEAEENDFYEEFLGYRKQTRNYLGHDFLETMWLPTSAGRKTLIEDGLTLHDGTFVKGSPSYPADATIVRITLANLPYLPATLLKQEMEQRLSCFGDVLDLGISKTDGIYHGEGYATINLTLADIPSNACEESHTDGTECPGHRHLEPLARVIIWDPRAVEQRKILLQWDQMPDFCRNCQSTDHCRADCPDYKKWVRCYHCNETGHVFKNCKRNGTIESAPAKVRAVANLPTTKKSRKGLKEPVVLVKDPSNTSKGDTPSRNQANQSVAKPVGRSKDTGSIEKSDVDGDQEMFEPTTPPLTDADALKSIARDVDMHETSPLPPRSPVLDPTRALKKAARTDGSSDISSMRQSNTVSYLSNGIDHTNLNSNDSSTTSAQAGQQSPLSNQ